MKKQHVCEVCNYSTDNLPYLKVHTKIHYGAKIFCSICGQKYVQKKSLENHVKQIHENNEFDKRKESIVCSLCSKKFTQLRSLENHIQSWHENTVINCNLCSYQAKCKANLYNHQRKKHYKPSLKQCEICRSSFANETILKEHVRKQHLGEKDSFSCTK